LPRGQRAPVPHPRRRALRVRADGTARRSAAQRHAASVAHVFPRLARRRGGRAARAARQGAVGRRSRAAARAGAPGSARRPLVWAARLVPGLVALSRVARTGERWHTPAALDALSEAARLAGVTRPVLLLRSSAVPVPATWGVRRPVIALPAAAATWTPERLRLVLVHELVHVRRQDVLVEALLWLAGALYWFHPAVWLAAARVRLERERACDAAVIATGARASDYCGHLVEIMRAATRGARGAVIGATMAAPCPPGRRVRAVPAIPGPAPVRPRRRVP